MVPHTFWFELSFEVKNFIFCCYIMTINLMFMTCFFNFSSQYLQLIKRTYFCNILYLSHIKFYVISTVLRVFAAGLQDGSFCLLVTNFSIFTLTMRRSMMSLTDSQSESLFCLFFPSIFPPTFWELPSAPTRTEWIEQVKEGWLLEQFSMQMWGNLHQRRQRGCMV